MTAHSLGRNIFSTSLRAFHSDYLVWNTSTRQAQAGARVEITCTEVQQYRIPRTSTGSCYTTIDVYCLFRSEALRLDLEVGAIFVYVVQTALQMCGRW